MSTFLPTRVWDWAMRQAGFLTAKGLGLNGATPARTRAAATAHVDLSATAKPPTAGAHATAN